MSRQRGDGGFIQAGQLPLLTELAEKLAEKPQSKPTPASKPISKRMEKRLEGIEHVKAKREEQSQQLGYLAKPFILCGFPFKPIKGSVYTRKNGDEFLKITGDPEHGLPFGADIQVPIWVSTLAVLQMKDGNIPREIEFHRAADMLKAFGLPLDGRTYRRMQERFLRVFYATYFYGKEGERAKIYSFRFFDEIDLWFTKDLDTPQLPGGDFKNNRIKISEAFAADLERHHPPVDLEMVKLWADKPGQLFFAMWLSYRCYTARGRVEIPLMGPGSVYEQCGAQGYADQDGLRNFRKKVTQWLKGVKSVWKECPVKVETSPRGDKLVIEKRAVAINPRKSKDQLITL